MDNVRNEIKLCPKCVMPIIDGVIELKDNLNCNICERHINLSESTLKMPKIGLDNLIKDINDKKSIDDEGHDCIISMSGGKDSMGVLHYAKVELGLNPLVVFINNGFIPEQLFTNAKNISSKLNCDLVIVEDNRFKMVFKKILKSKKPLYFCRLCHAMIDQQVKEIAAQRKINIVLNGNTKGQKYIQNTELNWVFKKTNEVVREELSDEFPEISEMFPNLTFYLYKLYPQVVTISPFWYIDWNEEGLINLLTEKYDFKLPEWSWPEGSSNCIFNYVSQFYAKKHFGYSQHEVELSVLVRNNELTRERAVEILNTEIGIDQLNAALSVMGMNYDDIKEEGYYNVKQQR